MTVLVLRVECHGKTLGEFPLEGTPVVLQLQDGETGRVVTTLTLEPGLAVSVAPPARSGFDELPPLAAGGDLFKDETVDLVLSNEDTLARGLARIREAARGAPGIINIQLPSGRGEPELVELSKLADEVPSQSADRQPDTARSSAPVEQPGLVEPSPELTEQEPNEIVPVLPMAEQDRSVTRTLSNGLADLLQQAEAEARLRGEQRPTVTEPIASDDGGRPTFVDRKPAAVDHEAPPTKVSNEPFLPQPIAPVPPPEGAEPRGSEDTRVIVEVESGSAPLAQKTSGDVGTDFAEDEDEPVTVVARAPASDRGRRPLVRGEYDELPVGRGRPASDDLSLGMPQDPGLVGPRSNYDELPVPEQPRRELGDDLSLSLPYDAGLTDASISELSLPVPVVDEEYTGGPLDPSLSLSLPVPSEGLYEADSDDDITLPLPEMSESSELHEPLDGIAGEPTVTNAFAAMQVDPLGAPQTVRPRLLDTTAGFSRDPSTERLEGAEVWFRRGGEWTPRGALNLGQHVQAFGGMVRCDDNGGLVVLAGPRLHGSATLPSGELRQIGSGQQAVHLPPGTSVIMWQGEQGVYVRSNVASDASGPVLDQGPVVYRRPPRSRAWSPPASDLEDT